MEIKTLIGKSIDRTPREILHYLLRVLLKREQIRSFNGKHPCVFVLSTGRVGTQTLSALLSMSENMLSYHEPTPILYSLSRLAYEYNIYNDDCIKKIFSSAFMTSRKELLDYSLSCGKGYVETSPQSTFLCPIINELISEVRFIHMVRDPRKVVISGMRRGWYAGHVADNTRIAPRPGSEAHGQWEQWNAFQKNIWLWAETNRWISKFTKELASEQKLIVYSEDIFAAKKESLERLFYFIHSPMPSEKKIRKVLNKKLNAQKSGSFMAVPDWNDSMYADLITIAGDVAKKIGYHFE